MHSVEKYYIQGFAMVIAPGSVVDTDIYFRTMGHSPSISGIDCYRKDRTYVGFVYPHNLDLEVKRAIVKYIRSNPKKWHRLHEDYDVQKLRENRG
jgi:hypothetical protein